MTAHFQVFVADFFVHIGHDFLREQMQKGGGVWYS